MRFLLSHKTLEKFHFLNFYSFLFPLHRRDTNAYGISFNLFNLHQDEPHACGLLAAVQAEWSEWLRKYSLSGLTLVLGPDLEHEWANKMTVILPSRGSLLSVIFGPSPHSTLTICHRDRGMTL